MNNPYLPLSNYFREDQRASNYYKNNVNDRYMPYVKEREELIRKFTPASNMNNDLLTDKIGKEYVSYNRIPYQLFNKDNRNDYGNRYQIEFNDYDNLNKKIYNHIKTPSKSVDISAAQYKIEPITSIEYDRENKKEEMKKLTEEDYKKYFEYMKSKEGNIEKNSNKYLPSKSVSIQYTPAPLSHREAKEYQRKIREREEELMKQYRQKKTYTEYDEIDKEQRIQSSDIAKHSKYYDDYCIKNDNTRREAYSPIISNLAKKNLIAVNPCKLYYIIYYRHIKKM